MVPKLVIKILLAITGIGLLLTAGCVMKVYDRPYPLILEPYYTPPTQIYYQKSRVEYYRGQRRMGNRYK